MFELKPLSPEGVAPALKKAERYRLLNEPFEAESICRDILEIEPENQDALTALILALTDQFASEGGARISDATELLPQLRGDYSQAYYAGIICERRGEAYLRKLAVGAGPIAYDWLRKAMAHYERAESASPEANDDAILRWNTCARMIMKHGQLVPSEAPRPPVLLE